MASEITLSNFVQGKRPRRELLRTVVLNYFLTAVAACGMGALLFYISERLFVAFVLMAIGLSCGLIGIFHLQPRSFTVSASGVALEGRSWSKEASWDDILEVRSTFGEDLYPLASINPRLVVITKEWKADLPTWKFCHEDVQDATLLLAKHAKRGTRLVDELGWMPTADEAEAYSTDLDRFFILGKIAVWVFLAVFLSLGFFGINIGTLSVSSSLDQPWVEDETARTIRTAGMVVLAAAIVVFLASFVAYRRKKKALEKEAG